MWFLSIQTVSLLGILTRFHIHFPPFNNYQIFSVTTHAESNLTDAEVDPTIYTVSRQLHERLMLHARIVGVSNVTVCIIL